MWFWKKKRQVDVDIFMVKHWKLYWKKQKKKRKTLKNTPETNKFWNKKERKKERKKEMLIIWIDTNRYEKWMNEKGSEKKGIWLYNCLN